MGHTTIGSAALLALLVGGLAYAQTGQNVYTTSPSPGSTIPSVINSLGKNSQTGALATLPGSPTNERLDGATMAVDALGRFLFVLNPTYNDVSMFQINASTGALTEVPNSPFAVGPFLNSKQAPSNPVALATESSGHFLYVGFQNGSFYSASNPGTPDGAINSFLIDAQNLILTPLSVPETDLPNMPPVARGMSSDAHGRNVYVAYGSFFGGESGIDVLKIDPATGALSGQGNMVSLNTGRAMTIDPQARFIFLAHGELAGYVDGWQLSPVDGSPGTQLNRTTVGSTGQFPMAIVEESSGHYLYVWVSSSTLRVFAIDQTSGNLTEVSGSPTPVASGMGGIVAADPLGAYLYASVSNGVHVYQINLQTGLLTEIAGSPFGAAGLGMAVTGSAQGSGIAGPLPQFDSTAVNFPDTVDGKTSLFNDRLVNNGQQALLINVNSIAILGAGFSQQNDCPVSLGAGLYCTFSITFSPAGVIPYQASLNIPDNGPGGQQSVTLMGNGTAAPPLSPGIAVSAGELDFSTSGTGQTNTQTLTVMSKGTSALHVTGLQFSGANAGDFSVPGGDNGCTASVAPNSSCAITVQFAPQALGLRSATLQVNSDGGSPSLSLVGIAAFAVSPSLTGSISQTVTAGGTAQYSLLVTPASGISGTVQVQCTGAPAGATCMVPASVIVSAGNSTGFSVLVATTSKGAGLPLPDRTPRPIATPLTSARPIYPLLAAALAAIALFELVRNRPGAKRTPRAACAAVATTALLAVVLFGCGNPSSSSGGTGPLVTPSGTYTLTLTLTSGTNIETINLTLKVQ